MRDALNSNPLVQAAVIGVLLIGTAFFVISTTGGGEEESSGGGETEATVSVAGTATTGTATGATPGEAVEGAVEAAEGSAPQSVSTALSPVGQAGAATPPLPRPVLRAWKANRTLVLLFVRDGGIDDDLTKVAARGVAGFGAVSLFVVPAHEISRYAAIAEGVGVDRVPALVVVTPKRLKQVVPTASVSYGFQTSADVRQAVIDAGYRGPTVDYHP
jgi:hypothetical protein